MKTQKTPTTPDFDDLLDCAQTAARQAGLHALRQAHRRGEIVRAFAHDIKLKLDLECQRIAEKAIRRRFPQHAILGEENEKAPPKADMLWIIDPIDGTVNYFHGLPLWCCSVAVQQQGQTLAGAVFAPVLNACYAARRGRPATLNAKPIRVSQTRHLQDAVVSTGIDKHLRNFGRSLERFRILSRRTQKVRIMGSAALDICHVAAGQADAFYEAGIYLWDIAAGSLIVEQAGGRAEILAAASDRRLTFLAANRHLYRPLKNLARGMLAGKT